MAFVDANVILELLLPGRRYVNEAAELLGAASTLQASMLSAHLVWHFGRHEQIRDATIAKTLEDFELIDLCAADYRWALANEAGKDFEDALQVAMALRAGCQTFITIDARLARAYKSSGLEFVLP